MRTYTCMMPLKMSCQCNSHGGMTVYDLLALISSVSAPWQDLSNDALPESIDGREARFHGAEKYAQIGEDGAGALVNSVMAGAKLSDIPALLVMDLYVNVGEMVNAFALNRASFSCITFLFGVCEDQVHMDWVLHELVEMLSTKYMEGRLKLPNGQNIQLEVSEDMLDPFPSKPATHVLAIGGGANNEKLVLPADVFKKWQNHPTQGPTFKKWVDEFLRDEMHTIGQDGPSFGLEEAKTPKRGLPTETEAPSAKKAKLDASLVVEVSSVTQPLLMESKLQGKLPLYLQIRANDIVLLLNKDTTKEHSVNMHDQIASFGKGAFKLAKVDDQLGATQLEFKLTGHEDLVVVNNFLQPLGKVLMAQRQTKPDAQICYHSITIDPECPTNFTLSQTHRIFFIGGEAAAEVNVHNIGNSKPFKLWQESNGFLLVSIANFMLLSGAMQGAP